MLETKAVTDWSKMWRLTEFVFEKTIAHVFSSEINIFGESEEEFSIFKQNLKGAGF